MHSRTLLEQCPLRANAPFVAIVGNSGVGKTTLTMLLARDLRWAPLVETLVDNPYYPEFVRDRAYWGLHMQLHYLARHARDSEFIRTATVGCVRDRSFWEGRHIYAPALLAQGDMSSRDFALYTNLYDSVAPLFPVPHLILYLQAECDWLQLRIARRGRIGEEAALTSLLVRTNELYEIWLSTFTLCPVLRYNAAALDCLHNAAHLTSIVHDVCSALDWHLPGDYVPTTE